MPASEVRFFEFDEFRFDVRTRELTRRGLRIALQPKAQDVLLLLLRHHDDLVTKQEAFQSVWPDAFVEDQSLTVQIHEIRSALGDDVKTPRYIRTVPRRGYRFVAPIKKISAEAESLRAQEIPAEGRGTRILVPPDPVTSSPEEPSEVHCRDMPVAADAPSSLFRQQLSVGVAQGRPSDCPGVAEHKPADLPTETVRTRLVSQPAITPETPSSFPPSLPLVETPPASAPPRRAGGARNRRVDRRSVGLAGRRVRWDGRSVS